MTNYDTINAAIIRTEYHEVTADRLAVLLDENMDKLMQRISRNDPRALQAYMDGMLDVAIQQAADIADAADALVNLEKQS